jgi:hypothetical protein
MSATYCGGYVDNRSAIRANGPKKRRNLLFAAALVCGLAGCGEVEVAAPSRPTVDEGKLAEARQQFSAFLDEATRGATLLESHPGREAIEAEIPKLNAALDKASNVYPTHAKMSAAEEQGRVLLRFFDACRAIAKRPLYGASPAVAKKRLDFTCAENARVIRQGIAQMRDDMVEPPPAQIRSSPKADDTLSAEK